MVGFDELKERALKKLEEAIKDNEVDELVLPYLKKINAHPDYFTTSSCYGRTFLIEIHGPRKIDSKFIERWHKKVSAEEVSNALKAAQGKIWLRFEPMILHISCRNMDAAQRLLNVKRDCGIKRGGIFHISPDRAQIELEGTQRLATLVKEGTETLVSRDYLGKLVALCNERFEKNAELWPKLGAAFSLHCESE